MAYAADIMTKEVVTVTPDTPVGDVAAMLTEKRFGSLPVVDPDGTLRGIVTEEDLVTRAINIHLPRHIAFLSSIIYLENPQHFETEAQKVLALTARDIMDVKVPAISPDTPVTAVASRLLDDNLRRLVVVDRDGRLLGLITRADIVRMLSTEGHLPGKGT